jgi:hypothetical protein
MRVKILDVSTENVVKGKSRYSKATVAYSYNGEAKTQNIMSFANPDVYKDVQNYIGQEVEVTVTKNANGYNEWAAIAPFTGNSDTPSTPVGSPSTGTPVRVTGSNYETPAERAQKQVYIVKQSSISASLEFHKLVGTEQLKLDDVIATAQHFVDYVFDNPKENTD